LPLFIGFLVACGGSSDGGGGGGDATTYTLTVTATGAGTGTIDPPVGAHTYPKGLAVTVTAIPAVGSLFAGWLGAATSTASSVTLTLDGDATITAVINAMGPVTPVTCHLPSAPNPIGPPMGWNSWNTFAENINEKTIQAQADAMVSSGMKAAGYQYVNIDAGYWLGARAGDNSIVVDSRMFPSGMKALADYIHGNGLKAGMYTDAGPKGCIDYYPTNNVNNTAANGTTISSARIATNAGSYGHYDLDMLTFSQWGYDYVKIDWCGQKETSLNLIASTQYAALKSSIDAAVQQTDRPMKYSVCEWGSNSPWTWAPAISDLWRTSQDIIYFGESASMDRVLLNFDAAQHPDKQSPGHYNDPDMLLVGVGANGGTGGRFTKAQSQTHLALWAISSAPLIAGNDLTKMDAETTAMLTNADMIAVDQDPLAKQAVRVAEPQTGLQVYSKELAGTGCRAVVLLNRTADDAPITVNWSDLGFTSDWAAVRDVWAGTNLRTYSAGYTATVPKKLGLFFVIEETQAP
jgi:hypothetical protein